MNNKKYIIGIDVGKTKIFYGLFTIDLQLVDCKKYPSGKSAQEILDIIEKVISKSFSQFTSSIVGISIASFGVIDIEEGCVLSSGEIPDWNHIPLKHYFGSRFCVPVYVENDVKAALFGEATVLKNMRNRGILYLSIGTNIGMAFMKNGVLCRGDNGAFGEICRYIPNKGQYCLGELIGGKGISQQYYRQMGYQKSGEEIFLLATQGDVVADEIIQRMITITAELMYWFDLCFDPSYLVLGGGVVCNNLILFQAIQKKYDIVAGQSNKKLNLARLGEKSGIYGAAALGIQNMHRI